MRDHSWSNDQFDKSDEVKWHQQTIVNDEGTASAPLYGEAVYPGDGLATYTHNNQEYSLAS